MIKVLFQSEGWLAADKPAGLTVHNDPGKDLVSLLSKQLHKGTQLHPVHRLDKETSGIILLATSSISASELAAKWASSEVQKIYYTVVRGNNLPESGQWIYKISDKAEGRKNPQGLAKDRVSAETHYKVMKTSPHFSLLEVELMTGRQHQIRKHAAISENPIVGDPRYGSEKLNEVVTKKYGFERMALHAGVLEIQWDKKKQVIKSELPQSFTDLLKKDV